MPENETKEKKSAWCLCYALALEPSSRQIIKNGFIS